MTEDVVEKLQKFNTNDAFWTRVQTVLDGVPSFWRSVESTLTEPPFNEIESADLIRGQIEGALDRVDPEMSRDERDEILDQVHRTREYRGNEGKARYLVSDISQRLSRMTKQQERGWPHVDSALLANARAVNHQLELVDKVTTIDVEDRAKSRLVNALVHSVAETRLPQSKRLWWSMGAFAFSSLILIAYLAWLVMTDSVWFEGDINWESDGNVLVIGGLAVLATIASGIRYFKEMVKGPGRRDGPNYSDSAISWWIATIAVLSAMVWVMCTMVFLPITDHSLRALEDPNSGVEPTKEASSVCFDRMKEVGATKLTQDGQVVTAPEGAKSSTPDTDDTAVLTSAPSLAGGDSISLEFGPYRLVTRLARTTYTVGDESSQQIKGQFVALPLGRAGSLHPRGLLVGHRQDGPVVTVFVCADPSQFRGNPTGSLSTTLVYQGNDASITPATVSVSLQSQYLWGLVPLIWLLSIFAVWLVLESWPRSARGLWLTILAVAVPTSIVFGGVLSNAGWTGNWRQLVTLVVAMYSAAVAAAATVKAGTSRGERIATSDS